MGALVLTGVKISGSNCAACTWGTRTKWANKQLHLSKALCKFFENLRGHVDWMIQCLGSIDGTTSSWIAD